MSIQLEKQKEGALKNSNRQSHHKDGDKSQRIKRSSNYEPDSEIEQKKQKYTCFDKFKHKVLGCVKFVSNKIKGCFGCYVKTNKKDLDRHSLVLKSKFKEVNFIMDQILYEYKLSQTESSWTNFTLDNEILQREEAEQKKDSDSQEQEDEEEEDQSKMTPLQLQRKRLIEEIDSLETEIIQLEKAVKVLNDKDLADSRHQLEMQRKDNKKLTDEFNMLDEETQQLQNLINEIQIEEQFFNKYNYQSKNLHEKEQLH